MKRRSNGEGTIFKRSDGRWTGQVTLDMGNEQYKRKTVYGKTQKRSKGKARAVKNGVPTRKGDRNV